MKFEQRKTKVQSEPLDFDLDMKQYQNERQQHRSGSSGLLPEQRKERVEANERKTTPKGETARVRKKRIEFQNPL